MEDLREVRRTARMAAHRALRIQKAYQQAADEVTAAANAGPSPYPVLGLPDPGLAARVAGTTDMEWFDRSGALTVIDWQRALAAIGRSFLKFDRIVDFGCGSGRVLRHLRGLLRPEQELLGIDVDQEAVAWVNEHLPGVSARALDLLPPSPIDDASVDLVVNQSVFTHLPEDVGLAWLADIHRILSPEGILIASFHGRSVWRQMMESKQAGGELAPDDAAGIDAEFQRTGFHHGVGRNAFESALPEYYGTACHTIDYIERVWQRWFRVRAWLPQGSLRHQDIVVLQRN